MEITKDIYFDNNPVVGKEAKITYSGYLFSSGSNNVNVVYGFGDAWNNTTTQPMEKTDNGFVASIRMRNFNAINFCFSDENNNWDNNNYYNYTSPILPEIKEEVSEASTEPVPEDSIDYGKDYSSSIDNIIDDILGNTTKQDIITNKNNNSVDKILETINAESLPEIEALFNDLFFESVTEDEKAASTVQEISLEPELAAELKEVGAAIENSTSEVVQESSIQEVATEEVSSEPVSLLDADTTELISLFNDLFEASNEPISFITSEESPVRTPVVEASTEETPVTESVQVAEQVQEEAKINAAAFNLDGLVSDLLDPVISSETSAEKAEETSLFDDLQAHEDEQETSLAIINSGEFTVASRKLGYFYKLRKRIKLALLKLSKLPKSLAKQIGF